jgi:hypothetical protein
MRPPIKKLLLNSHESDSVLEELRLVRVEITELRNELRKKNAKEKTFSEWINEKECMELTGLSRGTLLTMVQEGKITK